MRARSTPKPGYYEGYGGSLMRTRRGRMGARPLSSRGSLHLVLKSSRAVGDWSLRRHRHAVDQALEKFAARHGLRVLDRTNAGNHLHLHLKSPSRAAYTKFIRALTAAIAVAVTQKSRWSGHRPEKFWDYRPFSRVVESAAAFLRVADYLVINQLEMAAGLTRAQARAAIAKSYAGGWMMLAPG